MINKLEYFVVYPFSLFADYQEVVVRNDSACGSTIGPMMSAKLGIRTVDIGTPQLSMHSIRETCCTTAVQQTSTLYKVSVMLCLAACPTVNDLVG